VAKSLISIKDSNDKNDPRRKRGMQESQILILLEHNDRMTSKEILDNMNMNGNLQNYTRRLKKNGLITIYDQSKFKPINEANLKFHYHSITDLGRELISDLGR